MRRPLGKSPSPRSTDTVSHKFARKIHTGVLTFSYRWTSTERLLVHDPRSGKVSEFYFYDDRDCADPTGTPNHQGIYPKDFPRGYPSEVKTFIEKFMV